MSFWFERLIGAARLVWAGESSGLKRTQARLPPEMLDQLLMPLGALVKYLGRKNPGFRHVVVLARGDLKNPGPAWASVSVWYWRCTAVVTENRPACRPAKSNHQRLSLAFVMFVLHDLPLISRLIGSDSN